MPPSVTIVIPIHNEAGFLPIALPDLIGQLSATDTVWNVLLVENGSSDNTAEVARQLGSGWPIEVIEHPEPDYGAAMRAGFLAGTGDWIVNFDIDYYSGTFLTKALALSENADLVIASKRDPGSQDRRGFVRRLATFVFNLVLRTFFSSKVSDTHGMKAFRHNLVAQVAPQVVSRKDIFDTELVLRAERLGYRIVEVPVIVEEMRVTRSSLWRRAPRTLRGLLQLRSTFAKERRNTTSR